MKTCQTIITAKDGTSLTCGLPAVGTVTTTDEIYWTSVTYQACAKCMTMTMDHFRGMQRGRRLY